ncbi:MAG: trehalose-6-phosphate synthase [Dehalococcoidia bacterium]|nr:trehalose-6-phosphate synthase [Dehalococcoidia bacterium]
MDGRSRIRADRDAARPAPPSPFVLRLLHLAWTLRGGFEQLPLAPLPPRPPRPASAHRLLPGPFNPRWTRLALVRGREHRLRRGRRRRARSSWCWIHDYQLSLVPDLLRERGFAGRIGFFLHIPFPDIETARPYLEPAGWAAFRKVVEGMLGADLIGFQTAADVDRFHRAALEMCGAAPLDGAVLHHGRRVRTAAFPVGIDIEDVLDVARKAPVSPRVTAARAAGLPLVVGLERGDFTKGIPERLAALTRAFRRGARFAYLGIAAPTREGVRAYDALEAAVDLALTHARAAAASAGGTFSHVRANVGWEDVVALQRDADVVFTSSLSDGQNLVPLQAAIAQSLRPPESRAVILTGRDAGVASTFSRFGFDGLVAIDPLDEPAMAEAFCEALAGLPGRVSDRFIQDIRRRDAHAWATGFLAVLEGPC